MKTIRRAAVLAVVSLVGAGIGIYLDRSWAANSPTTRLTPPRSDGADRLVHALGSIQPSGGVIEVAVPAGFRALRFGDAVEVNAPVKKGQVLAYLDGYDERQCEVDVIDQEIKAAGHNLRVEDENERSTLDDIDRELEQNVRLGQMQLQSAALKIKCLRDKYELARKQLEAVEGLQNDNTIPGQEYRQLKVQEELGLGELRYAEAERQRQEKELEMTTGAAAIERQKRKVRLAAERARAQIAIETLRGKKALAEAAKQRCTVFAPRDGTILEISTREGESAAGKPLLKLGDTRGLYVMAEVYTDDREGVEVGQTAEIAGHALPRNSGGPIVGIVRRISPVVGGHKQSPLDPTYRENARVFEVWIQLELDRKAHEKIRQLILQPVDVKIRIDGGSPVAPGVEARS